MRVGARALFGNKAVRAARRAVGIHLLLSKLLLTWDEANLQSVSACHDHCVGCAWQRSHVGYFVHVQVTEGKDEG